MLNKELSMSYRKIRVQAINFNSDRNIYLRQAWAKRFLKSDLKSKVLLNIDESWLSNMDLRAMKWGFKGENNNLEKKTMNPRISLIVGIDTLGNIYYSISQSNSNSKMMDIFFKELTLKLDVDRPNWRKTTILLIDNAPYHTSKDTIETLETLRFPTMFLAPYAYDVAPCELFFAMFKKVDLNPDNLSLGKK